MGTNIKVYRRIPPKAGPEQSGDYSYRMMVAPTEKEFAYIPENFAARLVNPPMLEYTGVNWFDIASGRSQMATLTLGAGSATIAQGAGGLVFTAAAGSDAVGMRSNTTFTPSWSGGRDNGIVLYANAILQVNNVTYGSFAFGLGTTSYADAGSAPTAGIYLAKASGTGVVTGNVSESGTASATSTMNTIAASTEIRLGLRCWYDVDGATEGASRFGGYFTTFYNGQLTVRPLTVAQRTKLYTWFHSPAAIGAWLHFKDANAAGRIVATVKSFIAGVRI